MSRMLAVLFLMTATEFAVGAGPGDSAVTPGAVIAPADAPADARPPAPPLDPDRLARMVAGAQFGLGGPTVKPAPPTLTLTRGMTEAIPIGVHHLNRFRTPFRELRIETTAEAQIKKEGSTFYVATDGPEAVALFVIDKDNPDNALSLLLKPYELPPVDVRLDVPWMTQKPATPRLPSPGRDTTAWDSHQPYVANLTRLFRGLAAGQLPGGYRVEDVAESSGLPIPCEFTGLRLEPAQRIVGNALTALVARVSNTGSDVVRIDESSCAAPGVLAVAAWPLVALEPGDETELYIAIRPEDETPLAARPSVLRRQTR